MNSRRLITSNKEDLRKRYAQKVRAKEEESKIDVSYYNSQLKSGECSPGTVPNDPNVSIGTGGGKDWDVRQLTPEITPEQIYSKIKAKQSKADITLSTIKHIYDFATKKGISPVFIFAASAFETGWWRSGPPRAVSYGWLNKRNPGGLTRGPKGTGTPPNFKTPEFGLECMVSNMTGGEPYDGSLYFKKGKYTIAQIAATWAPVPANNDPHGTNKLWPGTIVTNLKYFGLDVNSKTASKTEDKPKVDTKTKVETKSSSIYSWPVPGHNTITSKYGMRIHPVYGVRKMHEGIDIDTPNDSDVPIVASRDGEVTHAGWSNGYGNLVKIKHSDGYETRYAHNKSVKVKVGDKVKQGQEISIEGMTGVGRGDHLHFEIRDSSGKSLDPSKFVSPSNTVKNDTPITNDSTGVTNNCLSADGKEDGGAGGVDVDIVNSTKLVNGVILSGEKAFYIPIEDDLRKIPMMSNIYPPDEYPLVKSININSNIKYIQEHRGILPNVSAPERTPRKSYALTAMNLISSVGGDLSKLNIYEEIPINHKSIKRLEKTSSNPYKTYLRKDLIRALEIAHSLAVEKGLIESRFILTSGYRTVSENINAYKDNIEYIPAFSPHLGGYAVDIHMPNRYEAEQLGKFLFSTLNFGDVGIGNNFIHVDIGPKNKTIRYY